MAIANEETFQLKLVRFGQLLQGDGERRGEGCGRLWGSAASWLL